MSKQNIAEKAQQWLNDNYPTNGDGYWSIEFILEVFEGKHIGHPNRSKVLYALASVEAAAS